VYIAREWHIPPSELYRLPYWVYQYYLEEIIQTNKREAKQREDQEKNQNASMPNVNNYMSNMNSMMNNFKMPTVNIPKL
jgi:hypothetical protein